MLFLYGEDDGRRRAFIEKLVHICLQNSIREFNYHILDAGEASLDQVIAAARTLPVMSRRRVVQVRNCSLLGPSDWSRTLSYLREPSPSTTLIFLGEKPSYPSEVHQAIQSNGAVLEFRPRSETQAGKWVADRVRREKKQIHSEAVRALVERTGTKQWNLEREIEKLLIFVGDAPTITEEHVYELSVEAKTHRVFDLTDALIEKRVGAALRFLHRLIEDGSPALALVGILARQIRLIWYARGIQNGAKANWSKWNSLPPFIKKRLFTQARKWDDESLSWALEGLARIDRSLKRGSVDPDILLDQWVLALHQRTTRGRHSTNSFEAGAPMVRDGKNKALKGKHPQGQERIRPEFRCRGRSGENP